ncbi:hypothetical protein [uncultured Dubosiella sp.]|uniref:hypothetical protein n=1 Tax=uncultured Dubosiella sp. TaxID=1937011 RepID=UPI0026176ED4|nr:hypothetical protein [uncultured Dubosiella sp.]
MEKKDSGQLMEKVFANLYNLMVPSSLDDNDPSVKLLSIMLPGITLGEELDPEKAKGKELLNLIADRIPKVSKNYVDSGKKVSLEYQKILGAVTPEDDIRDTEEKEAYKAAQQLLFQDEAYTVLYQTYLEKQSVYEKAQNAYLTEKNKAEPSEIELTRLKNEAKTALMN